MENTLLQNDLVEEREGFKIENLEGANWAFRKLRAIAAKEAEIKTLAEAERYRVDNWEQSELKQYEGDKQYFEYILSEYYLAEKSKDKKFKLSTPYGKVTARKGNTWEYENEEALIKYLKDNELPYVRTKEELIKTDLKKAFKDGINGETGEVLPFVSIQKTETISVNAE
jgi:hypothetical protein